MKLNLNCDLATSTLETLKVLEILENNFISTYLKRKLSFLNKIRCPHFWEFELFLCAAAEEKATVVCLVYNLKRLIACLSFSPHQGTECQA